MGLCLCTESNEFCFGENEENQIKIGRDKNKQNGSVPTNNVNEYTPMKCIDEEEEEKENKFNVEKIPTKNSNFNLYQKNNNITKSNDNVLLESFSFVSRSLDNSSVVDYYQMSRTIFEQINSIRNAPSFYHETLEKIIDGTDSSLKDLKETITNTDKNIVYSIQSYLSKMNKEDVILWNEKVYLTISNYLIEVEEKCNFEPKIRTKNASMRVSERLCGNYNVIEFNLNGFYNSETCVWNFLADNVDRLDSILGNNYLSGAVCCFPSKNNYKMRTIMYLVKKNNEKNIKLIGKNEDNDTNEEMCLCDLINKYSLQNQTENYIDKITGGNYTISNSKIKVTFFLYTGEVKSID